MATDRDLLFENHRGRLLRYFCRAVGRLDVARDLTQDVFLRVSRSAIPDAGDGNVSAWLFRIARNLALDHHRARRRHPDPSPLVDDRTRPAPQDVAIAVNTALASLPALDRDVFLMREVAGLSYDEIAGACELTPDAVRSRIHRARLELRSQLAAPISARQSAPLRRSGRDS
jgi:RNA polymerase sigma-70 factor (ECF subfamily)